MSFPAALFADRTFPQAPEYLRNVLAEARIEVTELASTGEPLAAEVLMPLMSRIDGAVMDRVRGLRLIHQWGAGLEGVDVAAATTRGIAAATSPAPRPATRTRWRSGA